MVTKNMERRKILLRKNKVNELVNIQNEEHVNYTSLFSNLCKDIANGYYDDKIEQEDNSKIRVNVYKEDVERAREKAKEKGYGRLADYIEGIIDYEVKKNRKYLNWRN